MMISAVVPALGTLSVETVIRYRSRFPPDGARVMFS